jgi:hypothetical protein
MSRVGETEKERTREREGEGETRRERETWREKVDLAVLIRVTVDRLHKIARHMPRCHCLGKKKERREVRGERGRARKKERVRKREREREEGREGGRERENEKYRDLESATAQAYK